MFLEYLKESLNKKPKVVVENTKIELNDPVEILRQYGIKIKVCLPHKEGYEISFFVDPKTLPLDKILNNFEYTIKDSKLYVKY